MKKYKWIGMALILSAVAARGMDKDDYQKLSHDVETCEALSWKLSPIDKKGVRREMHRSCAIARSEISSMQSQYGDDAEFITYITEHPAIKYGPDALEFLTYSEQCQHLSGEFDPDLPAQDKKDIERNISVYCRAAKEMAGKISRTHIGDKDLLEFIQENNVK